MTSCNCVVSTLVFFHLNNHLLMQLLQALCSWKNVPAALEVTSTQSVALIQPWGLDCRHSTINGEVACRQRGPRCQLDGVLLMAAKAAAKTAIVDAGDAQRKLSA